MKMLGFACPDCDERILAHGMVVDPQGEVALIAPCHKCNKLFNLPFDALMKAAYGIAN